MFQFLSFRRGSAFVGRHPPELTLCNAEFGTTGLSISKSETQPGICGRMDWTQISVIVALFLILGGGVVLAVRGLIGTIRYGEAFESDSPLAINERSRYILMGPDDRFVATRSIFSTSIAVILCLVLSLWAANTLGLFESNIRTPAAAESGPMEFRLLAHLLGTSPQSLLKVFCAILLPAALYATWFFIKRLFSSAPLLTIDRWGIRNVSWSDAVIPWHAITGVERRRYKKSEIIFVVVDPLRYPGKYYLNRLFKSGKVPLSTAGTNQGLERLLAMFRVHRPDLYRRLVA
jgi:hypothetical protein